MLFRSWCHAYTCSYTDTHTCKYIKQGVCVIHPLFITYLATCLPMYSICIMMLLGETLTRQYFTQIRVLVSIQPQGYEYMHTRGNGAHFGRWPASLCKRQPTASWPSATGSTYYHLTSSLPGRFELVALPSPVLVNTSNLIP